MSYSKETLPIDTAKLYAEADPARKANHTLFKSRIIRLSTRNAVNQQSVTDAIYLSKEKYSRKYGSRKTWVELEDSTTDLQEFYNLTARKIKYQTFRTRVLSLSARSILDREAAKHAATLCQREWITLYGGGKHRIFIYTGEVYPEFHGMKFYSIAAFLKKIGRYDQKNLTWNRLKNLWRLDNALTIPVEKYSNRHGIIYLIKRIKTDEIYVGLTLCTIHQRWKFHVYAANYGLGTKLAKAIREDGEDGFTYSILESGITDLAELACKEISWAEKLGAHGPLGLNTAKAGGLGSLRGKRTYYLGREFRSITEAIQVLSIETGLPEHVIYRRLINNRPLPQKARKHSKHPEAGSNIYRRWLALLKRHGESVCQEWRVSYDTFKKDISPIQADKRLSRIDSNEPWHAANITWLARKEIIKNTHGTQAYAFGVQYASLTSLANDYCISVSTLKNRIYKQGMSIEDACTRPSRNTKANPCKTHKVNTQKKAEEQCKNSI